MSTAELAARLHTYARGSQGYEAAVGLLVEHRVWLERADFVAACVESVDDGDGPPMAWIDWDAAIRHVAEAPLGERAVVLVAAELAGLDCGTPIGGLIAELDADDLALVIAGLAGGAGCGPTGGWSP